MSNQEKTMKYDMKMMMETIKQPYSLTMARHRLKKKEMQILMMILKQLKPRMNHDKHPFEIFEGGIDDVKLRIPVKSLLKDGEKTTNKFGILSVL